MFKQKQVSQLPSIVPLLKPLAPPEQILNLCLKHQQNSQKQINNKSKNLPIIEQQNYKSLYEQKCQELIQQITKSKQYEQALTNLEFRNKQLQTQIRRLQDERWNGYDYSRLSARGRSKSQKRVVPIVEVKLPARDSSFTFAQGNEQKFIATEREYYRQKISEYQREIHQCRLEIKQLKAKMKEAELKFMQTQRSTKPKTLRTELEWKKHQRGQFQHSDSPLKQASNEGRVQKMKTPQIAEFSPELNYHIQTVKKDQGYTQSVQHQIKRLKNELLYKDLLINKLKEQKYKENDILQRHLLLSVQQSKKMANQTTVILQKFKNQIIVLWKQLQAQKSKNIKLKSQFQKQYLPSAQEKQLKSNQLQAHNQNLLKLLKTRRTQNFQ